MDPTSRFDYVAEQALNSDAASITVRLSLETRVNVLARNVSLGGVRLTIEADLARLREDLKRQEWPMFEHVSACDDRFADMFTIHQNANAAVTWMEENKAPFYDFLQTSVEVLDMAKLFIELCAAPDHMPAKLRHLNSKYQALPHMPDSMATSCAFRLWHQTAGINLALAMDFGNNGEVIKMMETVVYFKTPNFFLKKILEFPRGWHNIFDVS